MLEATCGVLDDEGFVESYRVTPLTTIARAAVAYHEGTDQFCIPDEVTDDYSAVLEDVVSNMQEVQGVTMSALERGPLLERRGVIGDVQVTYRATPLKPQPEHLLRPELDDAFDVSYGFRRGDGETARVSVKDFLDSYYVEGTVSEEWDLMHVVVDEVRGEYASLGSLVAGLDLVVRNVCR